MKKNKNKQPNSHIWLLIKKKSQLLFKFILLLICLKIDKVDNDYFNSIMDRFS